MQEAFKRQGKDLKIVKILLLYTFGKIDDAPSVEKVR